MKDNKRLEDIAAEFGVAFALVDGVFQNKEISNLKDALVFLEGLGAYICLAGGFGYFLGKTYRYSMEKLRHYAQRRSK